MTIGMQDTLPFGKFKGNRVEEIFNGEGIGYLCWLRSEKTKAGDSNFFDERVNLKLDDAIRASKSLSRKYKLFYISASDLHAADIPFAERAASKIAKYSEVWGSW